MTVASRLREERKKLELSQTQFATRCGVRLNAQGTYERGDRAPNTDYLERAARYGVDVSYILTGQRTKVEPSMARLAQRLSQQYDQIFAIAKEKERPLSQSELKTILGFAFIKGASEKEIEAFMTFQLCEKNPTQAEQTIDDLFSSYIRSSLEELGKDK